MWPVRRVCAVMRDQTVKAPGIEQRTWVPADSTAVP